MRFFKSAVWLPQGQLWVIEMVAASLASCSSLRYYYFVSLWGFVLKPSQATDGFEPINFIFEWNALTYYTFLTLPLISVGIEEMINY